jgi:predicted HTH transcriptional regulator
MEITYYLKQQEGKTLEFKENCLPLPKIIQTVVAFANTAGGTLIIGVRDKTKEVIGLSDPLKEEERLANAFADGIRPLMIPDIQFSSFRDRNLIIVSVPHAIGPYYLRSEGPEKGVYVRLGSTNRRAGPEMIEAIRRLSRNISFDKQPCTEINSEDIDFRAASEFFASVSRKLTPAISKTLGLIVSQGGKDIPTLGAILLFGKNRHRFFTDAVIRCARFQGINTGRFLDQLEIDEHLPKAVETAISFIERHTLQAAEIGRVRRREMPEYPVQAVREAVINAVVHTDYSISGINIKVAIFDNRLEITNPGFLPFGLTLEAALSGVSKLRNRVIGRVFRELKLIEQWGTGLNRMISACKDQGLQPPLFEEIGAAFRVTLFSQPVAMRKFPDWQALLMAHLSENKQITTKEAARIWEKSDRTARKRLRNLVDQGHLAEVGTGPKDPKKVYVLKGIQDYKV